MLYGVWCHSTLRTDVWYAAGDAGLVTVQKPTVTRTQLGESGTDWPRCLAMHAVVHDNAKLVYDSLWYVQPMELIIRADGPTLRPQSTLHRNEMEIKVCWYKLTVFIPHRVQKTTWQLLYKRHYHMWVFASHQHWWPIITSRIHCTISQEVWFLQSVSIACYAQCCISYRKSVSLTVWPSVWPSVRHTLVSSQNDLSYDHGVFTGG